MEAAGFSPPRSPAGAARLRVRLRGKPTPLALLALATAVALLVLLPLGFLVDQSLSIGWAQVERLLLRPFVGTLLVNTVLLVAVATTACVAIGVGVAWLVERTDLPGRRAWAVLAALPITVPAFVTSYSWVSITPAVQHFGGAALIVTLAYYPLVYLPVAAVLRGLDPALEETARSLGMGPWRTFLRVTLPQTRLALLGGALLVSVHLLSEFGAFAMLRFQTFTTAIYDEYRLSFDGPAASMLATVLVLLCLALLLGELALRGKARYARVDAGAPRVPSRARLGRAKWPVSDGAGAARRPRARPAGRHARVLDAARRIDELPRHLPDLHRRDLTRAGTRSGADHDGARAARLDPHDPPPQPHRRAARTRRLPPLCPTRHRRRAVADRRLRAPPPRALRNRAAAARRLRDPLAAAGARRHARSARAGSRRARGARAIARLRAAACAWCA